MLILADANILLRMVEASHPQRATAVNAVEAVRTLGHQLVIVPQVVYEFWVVATRPVEVNGLAMSATQTSLELEGLSPTFRLLRDERAIFEIWQRLVVKNDVKGKHAHDARLVAAMVRHGISHLLTFNGSDFSRYPAVTVVEPERAKSLPSTG